MILARPLRTFDFDGPDEAYVRFLKSLRESIQREIEAWEHSFPSSRQKAPTSDDFRIVPFDPLATNNQLPKKPKPKPILSQSIPRRWKTELDAFLASLPTDLPSSKEAVGLNENIAAVNALLAVDTTSIDQTHTSSAWIDDISEAATRYALTTRKLGVYAQLTLLCARFREVILGCLSEVLHEDEGYKGLGNSILREGFGKVSEESCRRLRRGARFASWCVSQLSSTNWKHQGSELVYFGGRTLNQYARIAESSKSFGLFKEHLGNLKSDTNEPPDRPNITPSDKPSDDIPISIPCIIKCLVGNDIGLNKICKRLDHDFKSTLDVLTKWYVPKFGQRLEEAKLVASPNLEQIAINVEQNSHLVSTPASDATNSEVSEHLHGPKRQCRTFETPTSDPKISSDTIVQPDSPSTPPSNLNQTNRPQDSLDSPTRDDMQSQQINGRLPDLDLNIPEWGQRDAMVGVEGWGLASPNTMATQGSVFDMPEWGYETEWMLRSGYKGQDTLENIFRV